MPDDTPKDLVPSQLGLPNRYARLAVPEESPSAVRLPSEVYSERTLTQVASGRLRDLVRREYRPEGRAPSEGLRVQQVAPTSAFYLGQQIELLDICFRRAMATLQAYREGEQVQNWFPAVRPERAGLQVLEMRQGSVDLLWGFYGSLATIATSNPVAIASLFSLIWNSTSAGRRLLGPWRLRVAEEQTWGEVTIDNTKSLLPVLLAAVEQGQGVHYEAEGPSGSVRLIIPPRPALEP